MKKRIFVMPALIIVTLSSLVLGGCGRFSHDPEERADWMMHRMTKELKLDDNQQTKLAAVKDEFMAMHKKHEAVRERHMDTLIAEIQKPALDQSVLLGLVDEHKARLDEVAPTVIAKLAEFHASLNEEQKKKIVEHLQEFKGDKHHKHHW